MIDNCLRCSGSRIIKTNYRSTSDSEFKLQVKVGLEKMPFGMTPSEDWRQCSLYVCCDCGHSEFKLDKEHLGKLQERHSANNR